MKESAKTIKVSYLLEGMTCSGCERTISKVVGNMEGVQSAKADLESSTLSVEYDSQKVYIDKVRAAVNGLGYKFVGETRLWPRESSDEGIP
jgi:copper chaperone CopZ